MYSIGYECLVTPSRVGNQWIRATLPKNEMAKMQTGQHHKNRPTDI